MVTNFLYSDLDQLHRRWPWLLTLGIVLIALGVFALVYVAEATLGAVLALGWVLIISGIVEFVYAFHTRGWSGVLLHVVGGVLGLLIGLLVITHPVAGALVWTMLFAAFLCVTGLFGSISAIYMRFPGWGWALFDGIVTLVLGVLVWAQWPVSAIWFLGVALGIALILRGWTTVMFAMAVRATRRLIPVQKAA